MSERNHRALHVILFEPEIPPNTGNVVRLCANTGAFLHLVRPLGFTWDDRRLRRAGLDYDELACVSLHDNLDACLAQVSGKVWAFTTRAGRRHDDAVFAPGDALLFGPETRGLPAPVLAAIPREQQLRIPMRPGSRSLNLSNSVAVALYEAWRQTGFDGAAPDTTPAE